MPYSCKTHRARTWGVLPVRKDDRPSACKRGYGRTWQRLRKLVLHRDPFCQICYTEPSSQVDHIIPLAKGGTNSMDNLQGLCHQCHSRKTVSEDGGFGNE